MIRSQKEGGIYLGSWNHDRWLIKIKISDVRAEEKLVSLNLYMCWVFFIFLLSRAPQYAYGWGSSKILNKACTYFTLSTFYGLWLSEKNGSKPPKVTPVDTIKLQSQLAIHSLKHGLAAVASRSIICLSTVRKLYSALNALCARVLPHHWVHTVLNGVLTQTF